MLGVPKLPEVLEASRHASHPVVQVARVNAAGPCIRIVGFVWKLRIRPAIDRAQLTSLPLTESACPHVGILSFDLELPTTVQLRPCRDSFEQRRTNAFGVELLGRLECPKGWPGRAALPTSSAQVYRMRRSPRRRSTIDCEDDRNAGVLREGGHRFFGGLDCLRRIVTQAPYIPRCRIRLLRSNQCATTRMSSVFSSS